MSQTLKDGWSFNREVKAVWIGYKGQRQKKHEAFSGNFSWIILTETRSLNREEANNVDT